ncbi:MAG: AAA family ATPase [Rhodococcus sp. (in: high G+C Gram-positive bacteria)]
MDAVVVADFSKGLLDLDGVRDALQHYAGKPFLLRCKRSIEHVVPQSLPWTLICPNRQDVATLLTSQAPLADRAFRFRSGIPHLNPSIASTVQEILLHVSRPVSIFLKLDREGAVLVTDTRDVTAVIVDESSRVDVPAIGAGDVAIASMAVQLAAGTSPLDALQVAVRESTAYCYTCTDIQRLHDWYGLGVSVPAETRAKVDLQTNKLGRLDSLLSKRDQAADRTALLGSKVLIHDAQWYLGDYITLNDALGQELLEALERVRAYAVSTDGTRRPLVIAITGDPGAGKSTLAKELARSAKLEPLTTNVAQWTSLADLSVLCERVRSERLAGRNPLAFIDEVDATLNNEPIYGKLLAPLWDASYTQLGDERGLGPVVFVLAGSGPCWRSRTALLAAAKSGGERKLADLVSRLAMRPIDLPQLTDRPVDTIYLVASVFRRRFPTIRTIDRAIFELALQADVQHGVRSIAHLVDMVPKLSDSSHVSVRDLRHLNDLELHIPSGATDLTWRNQTGVVEVFD